MLRGGIKIPAKEDNNTLTYPQLTAFQHHEVEGKSIPKTAEIVGVDESTIDHWKKKRAWHDLAIAAIGEAGHTLDDYAAKLIEAKDKKKQINVGGKLQEVDDNPAQIAYLKEIAAIYGLYAPQKHEIIASPSDAELDSDLDKAAKKLEVESVEVGEQGASADDSQQIEGTSL